MASFPAGPDQRGAIVANLIPWVTRAARTGLVAVASLGVVDAHKAAAAVVESSPLAPLSQPFEAADMQAPAANTQTQVAYDCEIAAIGSFTSGAESLVYTGPRHRLNNHFIRQEVEGGDVTTVTAPDGTPENCVGQVTRTVRAGELVRFRNGTVSINTPLKSTPQGKKPEIVFQGGLGSFGTKRVERRQFTPFGKCGPMAVRAIAQYVEVDTSPTNNPSQVFGRVYQSHWVKEPCRK